ncbi:MAG TPA: ABC transporter permease, partial [Chitinophagales bacterium]|nr:ABC transporter permease [Chitinophagales bacterium]
MLKNYLKVALRNLWKNKSFSAINIFGLAVGLATCLLIVLFVQHELNYDQYNKNAAHIYRIDGDIQFGGTHFILAVTPPLMSGVLLKDYPEIEKTVRFRDYGGFLVKKGNENIQENKVIYTESALFDIFTLPMISGDPKTALTEPHSIVITKSTAEKYFNSTDVVGQTLMINDTGNYKITGVIENIPSQSHFNFDFLVALSESAESKEDNWLSNNFNTYIVVKPGTDVKSLETKINGIVDQYILPQAQQVLNVNKDDFAKSGNYVKYT